MKITDIAALANTSVATVSRVINGDSRVKASTKNKVLAVIAKTGYKPNVMGRNLRKLKSGNVLAILPTITNPIYSRIVQGVELHANAAGYDVMIVVSHRNHDVEKKYLEMLYTKEVDGAITFVTSLDEQLLEETACRYPLVLCSGTTKCEHLSYTCIDDERAAFDATQYLIGLGHTKVARINGHFSRTYEIERNVGYERAMRENGLPVRSEYMLEGDYGYLAGYEQTKRLMEQNEPPTAIFAFADSIASGCIKYLNERGIQVGGDVDVMGFDNIELGEILTPTLSTVSQPMEDLGGTAFDLLYAKMKDINSIRKGIILDHQLVLRQSTRIQL